MRMFAVLAFAGLLSACGGVVVTPSPVPEGGARVPQSPVPQPTVDRIPPRTAVKNFVAVAAQVEPVAERLCRERRRAANCDFQIAVDDRPGQPANAFQTLDANGRPYVVFTLALIADARNRDELAFVMGHEAAHHIAGHIPRQQASAAQGAVLAGVLASLTGASDATIQSAQRVGATVGSRRYAKDLELEADKLGTLVAYRAGYDPLKGAAFFGRIPDPGDRFLGTHPPNAQRAEVVRQTVAGLR